jgi:hypothetical protein
MCKAKNFANELLCTLNKIEKEFESYSQELSKYDLMEQDILHKIEFEKFNASEGYKYSKAIQNIRIQRRAVKNELDTLLQLKSVSSACLKGLTKIETEIVKKEDTQHKLKYKPRVIKNNNDLKLVISN